MNKRKNLRSLLILILCIALVIAIRFSLKKPAEIEHYAGDWCTIYFIPENKDVEKELINLIDDAKESIHLAVYDLELDNIVEALIKAKERGLDIKIVMDDKYAAKRESQYSLLKARDMVKTDNNEKDFMHNKFMIIDGETVWTGSANFTERGLNLNNNNVIVIESAKLGEDYEVEFSEMWDGEFGKNSPANTPYPEVAVDNAVIECYFAPEDQVENEIIEELEDARESICFATFTFTSDPIEEVLISKWDEGVEIKGIYESRQKSQYCSYQNLYEEGIPVIWDRNQYTMHNKVFIIDGETVVTGSFNPTKHANMANDENILIIHDSEVASIYSDEFSSLWNEWSG